MDNEEIIIEDAITNARYCYLCFAPLDANKACTDETCPLYGIPQE